MKIFGWIFCPFFMLFTEMVKSEDDNDDQYAMLFSVPIAILQITYWYCIVNFPVVFGI